MTAFDKLKNSLLDRGYKVSVFETAKEATDHLDSEINNKSVGFGGSMTLHEMGLYEKLSSHNRVSWHHNIPDGMTADEVRAEANAAQIYLSSVNGIAETGEIINIDGYCNRISSILYGHEKVYFVVGINKLAKDYDSALFRARNIAAPKNAQRLGSKTPCAEGGDRCYDCNSPGRICRGLSVLWAKPTNCEYEVVLIGKELGY